MVKVCGKCKKEKLLTEFNRFKHSKDGFSWSCKSCCKEYKKKYYNLNKKNVDEKNKKWRDNNKEHSKEYRQKHYKLNKEYYNEKSKKWYNENKEFVKEYDKKYRIKNKKKLKENQKKYYQENKEKIIKRHNKWEKNRRKTDDLFRLKKNLRSRTRGVFKNKGYSKNTKTQEMLGVDWEVAKNHIERQFTKGMNWNNYGEWHIDHIIPLASAKTPERLKQLCHYTNLQPMWAKENISKSDKIIGQQTLLRI